jgi:UDP-glucose 4-epimerase
MARVLVTGGAGYIGSHTVRALAEAGHQVTIYDSLEKGHAEAVAGFPLVQGNLTDDARLESALRDTDAEAVVHFAAYINVGESVTDPGRYFTNNTVGTLALLRAMSRTRASRLVFSSTAGVYGEPESVPVQESSGKRPENPYGASKWMVEQFLEWFEAAHDLRSVSLRYFNAAGAHPSGEIGEDHRPESHLIPLTLQVALGQRPEIAIFGDDYDTPDGTCVRDYVHVCDLASAHVLALAALDQGAKREAYNVGNGSGFSVKQVIDVSREVTGHAIPAVSKPRRPGDPARLVAAADRLRHDLGWTPQWPELRDIVKTAWAWHSTHPHGYGG